jgi:hypothetical protein
MAIRLCLSFVRTILAVGLASWLLAAPLIWILRDGLGPKSVDSTGISAVTRFLAVWGFPTLVLVVLLVGLSGISRRFCYYKNN